MSIYGIISSEKKDDYSCACIAGGRDVVTEVSLEIIATVQARDNESEPQPIAKGER